MDGNVAANATYCESGAEGPGGLSRDAQRPLFRVIGEGGAEVGWSPGEPVPVGSRHVAPVSGPA